MSGTALKKKSKIKKKRGLWMRNVLTRKVKCPFNQIGGNMRELIMAMLEEDLYNKCTKEGYIKKKSIKILSYSSGLVDGNEVIVDVMFECDICHPVEGQLIKCRAKNITRAGIRATYVKEEKSPVTIFIARDHHYNNEYFTKIKEEQDIVIRVIGIRYELNDETISVLGELKPPKINKASTKVTILD